MAKGDVTVLSLDGVQNLPTRPFQVAAGATAINFGEPVKLSAAGSNTVVALATNEPVVGTTEAMLGFSAGDSTQTASAAGEVDVFVPQPGVVYLCDANTLANIDTQAEYDALVGNRVRFDLTSGVYTINENDTHAAANGLEIANLDIATYPGKVAFILRMSATNLN